MRTQQKHERYLCGVGKDMKKKLCIIIALQLILIIITSSTPASKTCADNPFKESEFSVTIERIDRSITNENGAVIAKIYYDKPVIHGDSYSVAIINDFFDRESNAWFGGTNRLTFFEDGSFDIFLRNFEDMKKWYGSDKLVNHQLCYQVDTDIVFMNQQIISIKQSTFWFSGGPSSKAYFGSTFDLKSGQLLPLEYFKDINVNLFRENLADFLINKVLNYGGETYEKEKIKQFYGPNKENNFDACYYDRIVPLNYEYYYDGEYIYIIANYGMSQGASYIIKWNGKVGDAFDATLIRIS